MVSFRTIVCVLVVYLGSWSVEGHRNCTKTGECHRKECCLNTGDERFCVPWAETNTKCRVSQQSFRLNRAVVLDDFCPCGKDMACTHTVKDGDDEDIGKCEAKPCEQNKDCAWRHCCLDGFCRRRGLLGDACDPNQPGGRRKMMTGTCDCVQRKFYCDADHQCKRKTP